ncbi:PorT family protein [Solitalea sp. MAHUQ-68]|uniref:PorT family protein n=1 Tax=Solitalea agri TaxID=2953739 RepID=A0A9X2JCT2_9SPHI|nr:porin family protein [Solitalea agri]MCO4293408.1 PorT family protein [Solitalea agri]
MKKKHWLLAGMLLMASNICSAQVKPDSKVGVLLACGAGTLFPEEQGNSFSNTYDAGLALNIVAYYRYYFSKNIAVEPGLGYMANGWTENFVIGTAGAKVGYEVKNSFLNIPVTVQYVVDKFTVGAGPEINYLFRTNSDRYSKDNFNSFSYGVTGGLDYKFSYFRVGFNYKFGLAQVYNTSANLFEKKAQCQSLMLSFRYEL